MLHQKLWAILATLSSLLTGQCFAKGATDLNGYAFDCGGILLGFRGIDQIICLNGKRIPCGDDIYNEKASILTGRTSLTGSFLAYSLEVQDGVLVSFQSDLGITCNAVSLDWPRYSTSEYLGLKCPLQNSIPNLSYEDNHFSLGKSGDVALRSPLEFASGRRLVRDSYGVYQWFAKDEKFRVYFGPQHGQPLTILTGRLTHWGELYIQGFIPPGPCVHDGESTIVNATELPWADSSESLIQKLSGTPQDRPADGSITDTGESFQHRWWHLLWSY
jgi:hypothetical protein